MNEVQYYADMEMSAMGQVANENLDAILLTYGVDSLPSLARSLYKGTECGAWLSVMTWDGRRFNSDELGQVDKDEVRFLMVGSIIEGSDAEFEADAIDLCNEDFESTGDAVEQFEVAVEWVEDRVNEVIDQMMSGEEEEQ